MASSSVLNPHAPAFTPHHIQTTFQSYHHHHRYYSTTTTTTYHSSFQHFVYYPAVTTTFPPFPFHHQLQQQKEKLHGGTQPFIPKQFFKLISCGGKMEGHRRRSGAVWRPKNKAIDDDDHQRSSKTLSFRKSIQRFPVMPVRRGGDQTTVMVKNIPSKYTREMLVDFLERHCMQENQRGEDKNNADNVLAFDCVYLPIDFGTGMNKGYAFVNFTTTEAAWRFKMTASHTRWEFFQSHKVREVVAARIQGKEQLERYLGSIWFPCQYEEILPVSFNPPRDGVTKGEMRTVGNLAMKL